MSSKKGFTLVEVLISLVILGIVAATTIYILINIIPKEHEYLAKKPAVKPGSGLIKLSKMKKLLSKLLLMSTVQTKETIFSVKMSFCLVFIKTVKSVNTKQVILQLTRKLTNMSTAASASLLKLPLKTPVLLLTKEKSNSFVSLILNAALFCCLQRKNQTRL